MGKGAYGTELFFPVFVACCCVTVTVTNDSAAIIDFKLKDYTKQMQHHCHKAKEPNYFEGTPIKACSVLVHAHPI